MINDVRFSRGFVFGVADADLQVVGEDLLGEEGSCESAWSRFSKLSLPEAIGKGIGRYERTEEDAKWMGELGVKAYRTSVSMSRTLNADGTPNLKALEWYKNWFEKLTSMGMKIYLTFYHWELPQHLQDKGGWENRETLDFFEKHVRVVQEHLGKYVEEYFVVNEPWCASILGNFVGIHAPGNRDLKKAFLVAHHLLLAVGRTVRLLKNIDSQIQVGTVSIIFPIYAFSDEVKDIEAAKIADQYYNHWYLEPLFKGTYPAEAVKHFKEYLPEFTESDLEEIKVGEMLSSIGVNFYNGDYVRYSSNGPLNFERVFPEGSLRNDLDWVISIPPVYPDALADALSQIYLTYKHFGLKKLYVSENGMPQYTPDNGEAVIQDHRRIHYLREHLRQVYKARISGVPVEGYFLWTLMDNFEWQCHYLPESSFGLIHVNRKTLERKPKASFYWYKKVVESGGGGCKINNLVGSL